MGRGRGRDRKRLQHDRSIDRSFCACAFQRSHAKTHSVLCTTACSFPSVARTSPCVHTTDKSCVLWPQTNKKQQIRVPNNHKRWRMCVCMCVCVCPHGHSVCMCFLFFKKKVLCKKKKKKKKKK